MAAFVPVLAGLIGAGATMFSAREQRKSASKQRSLQREALAKQERIQQRQEGAAQAQQERLQREQSDELSRRRTRGRRSLLAGEERGVGLGGKRVTTGG